MCSAPGSKSSQIIELLNNEGLLISNDSDAKRCKVLNHQVNHTVYYRWNDWDILIIA